MRRLALLFLLTTACNTGQVTDDDGGATATECGEAALEAQAGCADTTAFCMSPATPQAMALCNSCSDPAYQCRGLSGCGGAPNAKETTFCEHCLLRPDVAVCEAGRCRPVGPTGNIQTNFGVPVEANGAKSFTIASILPTTADGSKVTCAKLTSTCGFLSNEAINTTNSTFKLFAPEADAQLAYPALISAEAGPDRLLFIQVTTDTQGKGTVVAAGCAEGISVTEGENTVTPIEILPI